MNTEEIETCCICLEELNENNTIKYLSCDHKIHFKCYTKLSYNDSTFFIKCPLCRVKNLNTDKPFIKNKHNLLALCSDGVGRRKCLGINKNGSPCQNHSYMFNYGLCHVHNKNILNRRYHRIFLIYFYYLLTYNKKGWKTKLYMLDMAKKLIIKHDIHKLEDIILIFTTYFERYNYTNEGTPERFYTDNHLTIPDKRWINYCFRKKIIF